MYLLILILIKFKDSANNNSVVTVVLEEASLKTGNEPVPEK
jgi:hypothetical protein